MTTNYDQKSSYEETLAAVRSLSENAVNKPWEHVLNCIPHRPNERLAAPSKNLLHDEY